MIVLPTQLVKIALEQFVIIYCQPVKRYAEYRWRGEGCLG